MLLGLDKQEIVVFYMRMVPDNLDVRPIKRLANVLTLFQVLLSHVFLLLAFFSLL